MVMKKIEKPKGLLKMEHRRINEKLSEPWYFTHI
jgi:hypothetical protein